MKKLKLLVIGLLITILVVLTGCGSCALSSNKLENPQDTDYVVYSNGGSAVQYGNYIYYINGTRGYADEDASGNIWGSVEKGGLYRTELNGSKDGREFNVVSQSSDLIDQSYDLKFSEGLDYDEEDIDVVDAVAVANKTVGTSSYADGGIFIYDDYIYFASPNNQKDRDGNVLVNYTDFYKINVDGTDAHKIFTTQGDASAQPYAFYHAGYNAKDESIVYLVASYITEDESTYTIASVKVEGGNVGDAIIITEVATSVYLPHRDTFDSKNLEYGLEDFVFYTRDVVYGEDSQLSGNLIEVALPDGSIEGFSFQETGGTTTIEGVRDDLLFYTTVDSLGATYVKYNNLNEEIKNIEHYANDGKRESGRLTGTVYSGTGFSEFSEVYCFRGNLSNSGAYMIASSGDGTFMYSNAGAFAGGQQILFESVEIQIVEENYLYFTVSGGSEIRRTELFVLASEKEGTGYEVMSDRYIITAGITVDIVAGHLVYFAQYDQWADAYTYFHKIQDGATSYFVGVIAEDDIRPEDWDEEVEEDSDENTDADGSTTG